MEDSPKDVPDATEGALAEAELKQIRTRRREYLCVLLLMIGLTGAALITRKEVYWIIRLPVAGVFLFLFLRTVHTALGYPAWKLVLIGVAIFLIPFVSLIVLAVVDGKIYTLLRTKRRAAALGPLCPLSYLSLILFWVPVVGLVLAIISTARISKSAGALRGKNLAGVSLVINGLYNVVVGFTVLMPLLRQLT